MSKNAELMSTAPSFYVVTRAPRSVSGKSSGQKQNTTAFVRCPLPLFCMCTKILLLAASSATHSL